MDISAHIPSLFWECDGCVSLVEISNHNPVDMLLALTTNDGEGRHARRDLHLDIDRSDLDALERDCGDALDHVRPRLRRTLAEYRAIGKNI